MLKKFKNTADKILRGTKNAVTNLRKKKTETIAEPQTNDTVVAKLNMQTEKINTKIINKANIEDSELVTEYHANADVETNNIVPVKNTEEKSVELRMPVTRKMTETVVNATVKMKDTTMVAVKESSKAFRFITHVFDAHLKLILFASTLCLIALGTVMIFSASSKVAMQSKNIGDAAFFVKKHLFFVGISFIALYIAYRLKLSFFQKHWKFIAISAFALLVMVLIPGIGTSYNGARRWIRFGPIGFQPSDFAKIAVVISLSVLLVKRQHLLHRFKDGFLPLLGFLGIFCMVLVVEPDFGTTLFLGTTGVMLMLIGGVRFRQLMPFVLVLLPVMSLFVVMKFDHIKPRLETYINPEADPMGKGYQIHQARIALAKGEVTGVGLGKSHQSLFYLPEESTDFIFAIIGEELGFIGTTTIVLLFMMIMMCGLRLAYLSEEMFPKLIATGLTTLIILQALINMMVVTALAPNKGIALPFISFGGSLTFFFSFAIGMILRIADEVNLKAVQNTEDVEKQKYNDIMEPPQTWAA